MGCSALNITLGVETAPSALLVTEHIGDVAANLMREMSGEDAR